MIVIYFILLRILLFMVNNTVDFTLYILYEFQPYIFLLTDEFQ